jgi:hypothetical protein
MFESVVINDKQLYLHDIHYIKLPGRGKVGTRRQKIDFLLDSLLHYMIRITFR